MFGSALGLALTHSCHLHISPQIIHELNQSFALDLTRLPLGSAPNHPQPERRIYNHCSFVTDLFAANTSQTIELTGFWQVHVYFFNHSTAIRQQLRFKSFILQQINTFLNNINGTRVGIHIRRGDFLLVRTVSSDQYVLAAMSHFTRKDSSLVFVIVTDDRPYCERVFGKRQDVLFTPTSFDGATDLATLSRCNHAIITVGTFGWWGAYLLHDRAGEVITDAKSDMSPIDTECEGKLYFPLCFLFLNKTRWFLIFTFRWCFESSVSPAAPTLHSSSRYLSPSSPFSVRDHELRGNRSLPSFVIDDYQSLLQMPPIKPLVSTFERQHEIDAERAFHSIELYAGWCVQSFILDRSAELNPFRTKYFLYILMRARFARWAIDWGIFSSAKISPCQSSQHAVAISCCL